MWYDLLLQSAPGVKAPGTDFSVSVPTSVAALSLLSHAQHAAQQGLCRRYVILCQLCVALSPNALPPVQVEACGLKLAHQFPWAASAYVAVGLALRRRELSYPDMPSSAPKRKQIMKVR